jgi:hypothetical protein
MVETGLNRRDIGKLILAACFATDLGTVLALGGFFATYGWLLLLFVAVTIVALFVVPAMLRLAIARLGHRVSEPEIKLILIILFALGGLAIQAGSAAVLPGYLIGLVGAIHQRPLPLEPSRAANAPPDSSRGTHHQSIEPHRSTSATVLVSPMMA